MGNSNDRIHRGAWIAMVVACAGLLMVLILSPRETCTTDTECEEFYGPESLKE